VCFKGFGVAKLGKDYGQNDNTPDTDLGGRDYGQNSTSDGQNHHPHEEEGQRRRKRRGRTVVTPVSALLQKRWDFVSLPLLHYQEFFSVWALHEACEQQIDQSSFHSILFFWGFF
jgi:hypothetical protein